MARVVCRLAEHVSLTNGRKNDGLTEQDGYTEQRSQNALHCHKPLVELEVMHLALHFLLGNECPRYAFLLKVD